MDYINIASISFKEIDNKYSTIPDGIVELLFITSGIKFKRISVPFEFAQIHVKDIRVEIVVLNKNPRIYDVEDDLRPDALLRYFKRIGFKEVTIQILKSENDILKYAEMQKKLSSL